MKTKFFLAFIALIFSASIFADSNKTELFDKIWKDDLSKFNTNGVQSEYIKYLEKTGKKDDGTLKLLKDNEPLLREYLYFTWLNIFTIDDLKFQNELFSKGQPGKDFKTLISSKIKGEKSNKFNLNIYSQVEQDEFTNYWDKNKDKIKSVMSKFSNVQLIKDTQAKLLKDGVIKPLSKI